MSTVNITIPILPSERSIASFVTGDSLIHNGELWIKASIPDNTSDPSGYYWVFNVAKGYMKKVDSNFLCYPCTTEFIVAYQL